MKLRPRVVLATDKQIISSIFQPAFTLTAALCWGDARGCSGEGCVAPGESDRRSREGQLEMDPFARRLIRRLSDSNISLKTLESFHGNSYFTCCGDICGVIPFTYSGEASNNVCGKLFFKARKFKIYSLELLSLFSTEWWILSGLRTTPLHHGYALTLTESVIKD